MELGVKRRERDLPKQMTKLLAQEMRAETLWTLSPDQDERFVISFSSACLRYKYAAANNIRSRLGIGGRCPLPLVGPARRQPGPARGL